MSEKRCYCPKCGMEAFADLELGKPCPNGIYKGGAFVGTCGGVFQNERRPIWGAFNRLIGWEPTGGTT